MEQSMECSMRRLYTLPYGAIRVFSEKVRSTISFTLLSTCKEIILVSLETLDDEAIQQVQLRSAFSKQMT